ncbi:GNAT family N-acetyltransferase [Desulfofalx alkaliphila]|uniref:GNAT family N-acetyltransferase n=1 Tax=Desulfofalx alkaliphila TaxID=105483 RepID=UPI000AFD1E96
MAIYDPDEKTLNQKDIQVVKGLIFTPQGSIHLEGPVSASYLSRLTINEDLNNFRPAKRQKESLIKITDIPNGRVFIARHNNEIIGYVTFHHPDEYSRWHKHPWVLELGAIEITKSWRKYRVAHHLLKEAIINNGFAEDFIIITIEYCWHWDLRGSNLTMWDYQRMLTKLFSSVGLRKRATDDPDILEHPANVLMVRIGKNVPKEAIQRFEELTFRSRYT